MSNYLEKAESALAEAREAANLTTDLEARVNALATVANGYRMLWETEQYWGRMPGKDKEEPA